MAPRSRPGSHLKCTAEELLAFGANGDGQLGYADHAITSSVARSAALLPRVRDVRQVACGATHVCVLTGSGDAIVAGANDHGQLGTGDSLPRREPIPVPAVASLIVTQVACGDQHTLLLASPGQVWAFGSNLAGQLGLGGQAARGNHPTPRVLLRGNVRGIACGGNHSILLLGDTADGHSPFVAPRPDIISARPRGTCINAARHAPRPRVRTGMRLQRLRTARHRGRQQERRGRRRARAADSQGVLSPGPHPPTASPRHRDAGASGGRASVPALATPAPRRDACPRHPAARAFVRRSMPPPRGDTTRCCSSQVTPLLAVRGEGRGVSN